MQCTYSGMRYVSWPFRNFMVNKSMKVVALGWWFPEASGTFSFGKFVPSFPVVRGGSEGASK